VRVSDDGGKATVRLAAPAYVVMLQVAPGKSIDALFPRGATTPTAFQAGTHAVDLAWPAMDDERRPPSDAGDLSTGVRTNYERCLDDVRRRYDPPPRIRRPVIRDSTGRVVSAPDPEPPPPDMSAGLNAERQCLQHALAAENARRTELRRQQRTGYLVLLVSRAPVPMRDLAQRIDRLTVKADDAESTIEAVASAVYLDRPGAWAGYYRIW
jgi:hypothetical protein